MHAILCFSATHLKHINPTSQVYDDAVAFHKHHALSLLRRKLESLTEPSSPMNEGIYGTGVILALQSVATYKSHSNSYPTDLDWLPLISGFKSVVLNMWDGCRESIFYPLITAYMDPDPRTTEEQHKALNKFNLAHLLAQLPPSYSAHVSRLACIMDPFFPNEYYASPLASCAPMLRGGYERIPGFDTMRQLFGWIATLPESFMPRAKESDPSVLILLGWVFSSFRQIYSHNPIWWIERISKEGVEDIDRVTKTCVR
jgi:Fungal specific transcription factor domain